MKPALEILNRVEPNGELLNTDTAIKAMKEYAMQFIPSDEQCSVCVHRRKDSATHKPCCDCTDINDGTNYFELP